ncbi:vitamin K epoxide reductase family protein [Streptomyces sp. I05A-00742]|uniref:vitamin K epoxide reductase family protein n=1 Tax=Streptomyces sp. I05A-00742 TaxID=2732853 RepID=UPI001487DB8E|nr:vitamin K epoxide reductase family protein [Streptomyces sp. I05A-00742]
MTDTVLDRSAGDGVRGSDRNGQPEPGAAVGAGRPLAWLLIVAGVLGLLASFEITVDKIRLAENPGYRPPCNVDAVVSCTSVMRSEQASAFGFPNPLIGLVAYAVVVALGVVLLTGARFRRWFWLGLNLGALCGAVFCMWLMSQALYSIGALCLWCCLAWVVTIAIFWYSTVHNIKHRFLPAPRALRLGVLEFHWVVPAAWYGVIALLAVDRFWAPW